MKTYTREVARLVTRAVPAITIGGLVLLEVLRRNGGIRTPQIRGGWTEINVEEYEEPSNVIPLFPDLTAQTGEPHKTSKIIDVEDMPGDIHRKPKLDLVKQIITAEDVPIPVDHL